MNLRTIIQTVALGALLPLGIGSAQVTVINVEVDYMVATGAGAHSHMLQPAEVFALQQMFACHGITLNVFVDDALPEIPVIRCSGVSCNPDGTCPSGFFTCSGPSGFAALKAANFDNAGGSWHYALMGHQYDCGCGTTSSSGLGEIGGDDFVVTMGSFFGQIGTPFDRAATFAHELGHNLGLEHFSPASGGADLGNFAPNYASVMSYQYQLRGVRSQLECSGLVGDVSLFKDLDYSNGRLPALFEYALDETLGVGIQSTDFDCDGVATPGFVTVQDLDNNAVWCSATGTGTNVLRDWDDWSNLIDNTGPSPLPIRGVATCITAEEAAAMAALPPDPTLCTTGSVQPLLMAEPCTSGRMIWANPNVPPGGSGTGSSPFGLFRDAVESAPPQSVLYLQPGTFADSGLIVIDSPMTLTGPGSSVVSN